MQPDTPLSREAARRFNEWFAYAQAHYFAAQGEYDNLPLLNCGYNEDNINTASPEDMEMYYSREKQNKYGVVGIEISLL